MYPIKEHEKDKEIAQSESGIIVDGRLKNIVVVGLYFGENLDQVIPDLMTKMGCENDVKMFGYNWFGKMIPFKDRNGKAVRIRFESVSQKWLILANAGKLKRHERYSKLLLMPDLTEDEVNEDGQLRNALAMMLRNSENESELVEEKKTELERPQSRRAVNQTVQVTRARCDGKNLKYVYPVDEQVREREIRRISTGLLRHT